MTAKLIEKRDITLNLDDIHPDPFQPRTNKPTDHFREVGESIKANGQRNRIHVWQHETFKGYRIINGECRYMGSVLVGLPTIEAVEFVFEGTVEDINKLIFEEQIMDNVVRKQFDPLEFLQACRKAIDEHGSTIEDLAQKFGKSADLIEKDLPILRLPENLLKLYDEGILPKTVARRIAEFPDQKSMKKAWEWARNEKNAEGMLAKCDAYNNAKRQMVLFAKPDATPAERKEVKAAMGKLVKAINEFSEIVFDEDRAGLLIKMHSRELSDMEALEKNIAKIATKLKSDLIAFKATRKDAKAA